MKKFGIYTVTGEVNVPSWVIGRGLFWKNVVWAVTMVVPLEGINSIFSLHSGRRGIVFTADASVLVVMGTESLEGTLWI